MSALSLYRIAYNAGEGQSAINNYFYYKINKKYKVLDKNPIIFSDMDFKNNPQKNFINVISYMWNVTDTKRLVYDGALPPVVNIEEEIQYKRDNFINIKECLKVNRNKTLSIKY